jgi:type I restriction enzyme M protein
LLPFVHGRLIPYLANLSGSPVRDTIASIFAERTVIVCASPYNLGDVLDIVDGIDFHSQDDIFAVSQVYEGLLQRLGNENRMAGEFYTPRSVVRFIVHVVNPQVGETIYDPAAGSCGFLAQAYEHILARAGQALTVDQDEFLQRQAFYGQEKKAVPALLGLMNMVLHAITAPNVARRNTLEENIRAVSQRYDVVLTNPPFGGTENRQIQANFPVRANATELLFVQHIMKKLKVRDGARCGMVVPEGTLFRGGAFATVKQELLEQFNLHTVVSLPPGTFAPYSDVKTALLFFRRPGPTRETWYYELPLLEGLKKFSKGSLIQDEHFAAARVLWAAWDAYCGADGPRPEPTANSWIVPMDAIKARGYDLSARNPSRSDQAALPHPAELTASILERVRELQSVLANLHEMVSNGSIKGD